MKIRPLILALLVGVLTLSASAEDRVLFDFEKAEASQSWWVVNDGVMGGISQGSFKITEDQTLQFTGILSLENNGGFASIRARGDHLKMHDGEHVKLHVRGDGREYNFNFYTRSDGRGYSYRQSFQTVADEWVEVSLPVDEFVATWRGRVFPNETFRPSEVVGLGILLGDKNEGPFTLEIDWIQAGPEVPDRSADLDAEAGL